MEQCIFDVLRKQGVVTSGSLLPHVYPRERERPFHAQIVVNRACITLAKKLAINDEVFRIERKKLPIIRAIETRLKRVR